MKKKKMSYIIVPLAFTVLTGLILFFAAAPVWGEAKARWQAVWIMNAPEYSYEQAAALYGQDGMDTGKQAESAGAKLSRLTAGTQYGKIVCEKWAEEIPLYYGDSDDILKLGAGTYTGYGMPGEGKRILVGAHDTTYFSVLEETKEGDIITLHTIAGSFSYQVSRMEAVEAGQALQDMGQDSQEELILYTCYPFGETSGVRTLRYLVYAAPLQENGIQDTLPGVAGEQKHE